MGRTRFLLMVSFGMLLAAGTVDAGGDSRAVRITSFSRVSPDQATFVLEGLSEPAALNCPQATIHARYAPWWRWPWEPELVSRKQHREALDELARDHKATADTRFGVLGTGLGEDPADGQCHFVSRALAVLEEIGGNRVVYSYFKHP